MHFAIWHMKCSHTQEILLNCKDPKDVMPYIEKAQTRGTCKTCGTPLEKLSLVVLAGEFLKTALKSPSAIDMGKGT